eukprot:3778493-Pyramimonas_sp.AAC.1
MAHDSDATAIGEALVHRRAHVTTIAQIIPMSQPWENDLAHASSARRKPTRARRRKLHLRTRSRALNMRKTT